MTKRVFIVGHYGFGNTGDEAILISMLAHLRELSPELQVTVGSGTPAETAAALGVETILWSDARAVFETVRETDLVIVGGGGIFHDYLGVNPDAFLTDNHWGVSFFAGPAMMAMLCAKPVMLYAVGVGPLFSDHAKQLTKIACDAAVAITVRDGGSLAILESIGVAQDRVTVTADPAFAFPRRLDQTSTELDAGVERPRVVVVVRPWRIGTNQDFWEREVAAGLDHFVRVHGGSIVFVPFERSASGAEDDLVAARRVHGHMKQGGAASVVEEPQSPEQTLELLAGCDLVVGMRLHSLILGMLAKIPVLSLRYDAKVDQVMELAGMQDFNLDIQSLDGSVLAARMWDAIEANRPVSLEKLASMARRNAAIAIEALDSAGRRPLLEPQFVNLLARGLQAQLRDVYDLRREARRLYQLVEFYQDAHSDPTNATDRLLARIGTLEAEHEVSARKAAAESERDKTFLQTRADDLATLLSEARRDKAQLQTEMESLQETARQLTARLGLTSELLRAGREHAATVSDNHREAEVEWKKQISSLKAEQDKLRGRQAALEDDVEKRSATSRERTGALRKAEEVRLQLVGRLRQFQDRMAADLVLFRAQRAWKVMLAIRKGYTILNRRGAMAFGSWAIALPFAGTGPLDEYELTFPDVRNYLPERLAESHLAGISSTDLSLSEASHRLADIIPQRKYDIVILAIFDFDFRFQRPQQLAAQFAREGHRVFWVSPARFLPASVEEPYQAVPLRENLWEVRLRGKNPDLYGGQMGPEEKASLSLALKCLYRDFHLSETCVLIQFPYWRQLGLALREEHGAKLVYDCMDDWQNWTAEPRIGEFSLAEERKLVSECDVLVVTSEEFCARHQARGLKPLLARNATDLAAFSDPPANDLLAGVARPIIGYYGAIADWFDLDLLAKVAAARPAYSFVLIGQVHQVDTAALRALSNVHFLGEKHYREIPLFLSNFDVGLIPFKLTALTKGVDPVKLYEYLSQGKPVVATPMDELPRDPELLYTGKGADEFVRKIDLALEERRDSRLAERRRAFARENTWAMRVHEVDGAIANQFPLVSILVVTHNCEEFMEPCLDSVARNTSWPQYEVIVVDNNSSDATAEIIVRYAKSDERIRAVMQAENKGFARANNLAAQQARGEYLVFLNPDTIVTPGWLGRMVRHCELDSRVGAVAAVTNFSGNETKIAFDYCNVVEMHHFALKLAAEKGNEATEIDMAALYCVLIPRAIWVEVGELDPKYRIGMFEDDDLSLRIRRAGYRIVAAESCFVHHFGNGSFAKLAPDTAMAIFEENRQYFEKKWNAPWKAHKLRPGVRPPAQEPRFTPKDFLRTSGGLVLEQREPIELTRLHPPGTLVGTSFNTQADSTSALAVDCSNATPDTVIVMGSTTLRTAYGSRTHLTGVVPPELYARAGKVPVYLLNAFGESSRVEFAVEELKV